MQVKGWKQKNVKLINKILKRCQIHNGLNFMLRTLYLKRQGFAWSGMWSI